MRRLRHSVIVLLMLWVDSASASDVHFTTYESPPYVISAEGCLKGPFIDVVQTICLRLKRTCTIELMPFRRALLAVETGDAQGMFPFIDMPLRRIKFDLSPPVISASLDFMALAASNWVYSEPSALEARTIGVFGPSSTSAIAEEIVKHSPHARVEIETDASTALRKLDAGRYGADGLALVNRDLARDLVKNLKLSNLRDAGSAKVVFYTVGFSRSFSDARFVIDFFSEITKMENSGELKEMTDHLL